LIIGVVVLSFSIYQADTASFTHDESLSYLNYTHYNFMHILRHESAYTNNHLLNTLGMKYSELLFGSSELSIRLPNIMALVLYMIFSFLLFKKYDRWFALAAFIILISNAYLIDLFSMARGYGLSFGFMFMTIYFLIRSVKDPERQLFSILFHVAALLAALSNFTMLLMYAAALIVHVAVSLLQILFYGEKTANSWKVIGTHIIMLVVSVAFLFRPVLHLVESNTFDFGGRTTFIESTVRTVITNGFYGSNLSPNSIIVLSYIAIILIGIMLAKIVTSMTNYRIRGSELSLELVVSNSLLISICVITIIQHYVTGSDYLIDRFAFFLWPLFLLNFLFVIQLFWDHPIKWIPRGFTFFLAGILGIFFLRSAEPQILAQWGYDTHTKKAMEQIALDIALNEKENVRIGCNWLYEPTLNFYRSTRHMNNVLPIEKHTDLSPIGYDHLFISSEQAEQMDLSDFEETARYEPYECIVLRRTNKSKQTPALPLQDANAD